MLFGEGTIKGGGNENGRKNIFCKLIKMAEKKNSNQSYMGAGRLKGVGMKMEGKTSFLNWQKWKKNELTPKLYEGQVD